MPHNWSKTYTDSIRGLSLDKLIRQIEAYTNGYISEFALTCEAMQEGDDVLKNVIAKRKKAVARHGWEILTLNNLPEARAHQQALEYFYGNLRCSSVLKQDENGGFGLLVTQMMDAVAKGFAVHEIAWQPRLQPETQSPLITTHNSSQNRGRPNFPTIHYQQQQPLSTHRPPPA